MNACTLQPGSKQHLNEEASFWDHDVLVDELPLMSTAAGYAAYPFGNRYDIAHGTINFDVRTLTGEEFTLRVERSMAQKCGRWFWTLCQSEVVPSWFWIT